MGLRRIMAAIDTLITKIRRDTRDTGTSDGYDRAFTQQELTDLVELALAEVSRAYPREITTIVSLPEILSATQISSVSLPSGWDTIYRIDGLKVRVLKNLANQNVQTYEIVDRLDPTAGDGPYGGWEIHAGNVYLQPARLGSSTTHLRLMGYGNWTVDTLDADAEQAVRYFVQSECMFRLVTDRSIFQQWQLNPGNTDVTVPAISQMYAISRQRYDRLIGRLRKLKKVG
jgi:hypothetical protein